MWMLSGEILGRVSKRPDLNRSRLGGRGARVKNRRETAEEKERPLRVKAKERNSQSFSQVGGKGGKDIMEVADREMQTRASG